MKKIPILLIGGFLGSGKTTLLNRFLTQQSDQKIAVIVNDFGTVNIDSKLVAKQADQQIELTNGCICCETGEDGIGEVLESIAHEGSMIDVIVVETSGLADPMDTMKMLMRVRNQYCRFDSTVYVVDASAVLELREKHHEIDQHIAQADVIVMNKLDLIDDDERTNVREYIAAQNKRAMVIETEHSEVDTRLLFTGGSHSDDNHHHDHGHSHEHGEHCTHEHMHTKYRQITFDTRDDIDPKKVFALLEHPPKGVYRMKGTVNFGMKGMSRQFTVQFVAGRHEIKVLPQDRWQQATTELVVIGDSFDEMAVTQQLAGLVDDGSEPLSADTMLDIFMFE